MNALERKRLEFIYLAAVRRLEQGLFDHLERLHKVMGEWERSLFVEVSSLTDCEVARSIAEWRECVAPRLKAKRALQKNLGLLLVRERERKGLTTSLQEFSGELRKKLDNVFRKE